MYVVKELILKRDPEAKIIVIGDFNLEGMKKTQFLLQMGLKQIVQQGEPTHRQGNTLDQIWTNLEVASAQTITMDGISDHKIVLANLVLKGVAYQKKPISNETYHTRNDIYMITNKNEEIKRRLAEDDTYLDEPFIERIKEKLQKREELQRWWRPMPEFYCNEAIKEEEGYANDNLTEWKKKLIAIE